MVRKILFILSSLVILGGFVTFILEKTQVINMYQKPIVQSDKASSVNTVDYSPAVASDNSDNNNIKQKSIENTPKPSSLNVTLTRATQLPNTKTLVVRALIEGLTEGVCSLTLSQGESIGITKQATITQQNNIFTCDGFDIPLSELPSGGNWVVKLTAQNGLNSSDTSQNIMLEK